MWNFIAGLGGKVVDGVANYAAKKQELKQVKLEGDIELERAKAEAKVAEQRAKRDRAAATDKATFDLDKMAVAEAAKTWWDEFLVLIYISPLVYALFFAIFGGLEITFTGGFNLTWQLADPEVVWAVFNNLEEWYRWGLVLIGVRYLGFRNLLRKAMEMYSKKKGL